MTADTEGDPDADPDSDAERPAESGEGDSDGAVDSDAEAGRGTGEGAGVDAGRVRSLVRPSPGAARELAAGALERGDLLALVGRCTVDYEGRAASDLGPGERHVMLKPDGTAMVHTVEGRQPVNWQPPGSDHAVALADGHLRVTSTRTNPDEELAVTFERVLSAAAYDLVDEADLDLAGTHEDLVERVLADPDLVEEGFAPLATERETPAGAVDVYGEDAEGRTVVLELKRSRAGPDAVGQLERYVDALRRDLHADAELRGVLVAPSATDRARRMLDERGLEFVALAP